MMAEIKKCCLNCENWRVAWQNLLFTNGVCDVSFGSTYTDKKFLCGKFEYTKQLQEVNSEK